MKRHRNLTILALVLGLAGALLATAGVASGVPNESFSGEVGVLRLHLGAQDYFQFDPGNSIDGFADGPQQDITLDSQKCDSVSLSAEPAFAALSAAAGKPGLVDDGFGVRITGPQGTKCGQIDGTEKLILALGADLSGNMIDFAEIDFEIKFDADVLIEFFDGPIESTNANKVGQQIVSCDPSDCGPDSADGDNYRELVKDPDGDLFDRMRFSVDAVGGPNAAASLEGGADGTLPLLGGFAVNHLSSTTDSVFHIVRQFDGDLACGDTAEATNEAGFTTAIQRIETTNPDVGDVCEQRKPYTIDATTLFVSFDPFSPDITANYRGDIVFDSRSPSDPQPILQYDRDLDGPAPLVDMQACNLRSAASIEEGLFPELAGPLPGVGDDLFPSLVGVFDLIDGDPVQATWCLAAINTTSLGGGTVIDVFATFGNDDPSFRWR